MSKLNKGTSPEISDDDDSFNIPSTSTSHNNSNYGNTVVISSDEDTIPYKCSGDNTLSSDDEDQDKKSKISRDQWSLDKQNVVKKLFPNTITSSQKTQILPSTFKQPSFLKMIGGVEVDMPVPPYGCQIALMSKVFTIF